MDDRRFDDIVKQMASTPSRRSLLKAGGGAALGLIGTLLGRRAARAAPRGPGAICRKGGDCNSGLCGAPDFTGRRRCVCSPTQVVCGGACVDPATAFTSDPNNCGACGTRCTGTTSVCCNGSCIPPLNVCSGLCCPGAQVCFTNACCTPESNEAACEGLCGPQTNNCGQPVECGACCATEGSCTVNSDCCSNVCIDLVCVAGPVIEGAACDDDPDCQSGACCGDLCVASDAYDADVNNCGSCGGVCPGQDTECSIRDCFAGHCGVSFVGFGTVLTTGQTAGDCQTVVCTGTGSTTSIADNTDTPTAGTSDCMLGTCFNGVPSVLPAPINTACDDNGGSVCTAAGACVECNTDDQCTSNSCDNNVCCVPEDVSVTCANVCGPQTNNCDQIVECTACCPAGQRPSTVGAYCVPDATACAAFKSGANIGNGDFRECDFSGQTIVPAGGTFSNFTGANFSGATLTSVNFQFSNLTGVNFTGATLTSEDWRFANLTNANFSNATFVPSHAWTAPNAATTCPDGVAITTGTCCSHMNGNNPTVCF